jgi:hypothetical protein
MASVKGGAYKAPPFFVWTKMQQQFSIEPFNFWMPIEKAGQEVGKDGQTYRKIRGVASTPDEDLQGEIVDPHGIDVDYFLTHGYFNNDHKPGFENKVGFPTTARISPDGLYVEGSLFNNNKVADDIWNLMHSIEATPGSNRKVGFSVQGKVKRRAGNKILACWIQDVAITPAPINTKTWAEVAKSLSSQEWANEEERKAIAAGYGIYNQTDGNSLVPQSLDHAEKVVTFGSGKKLNKSLATLYVQFVKGYSRPVAKRIVDVIFSNARGE